jgi:hypothetical protein
MSNTKNKKLLPLSGSERVFRLEPWLTKGKRSNNCYAYAMNDYRAYRQQKSVIGDRSGLSKLPHTYTHCKDLARRLISDNPKKVYKAKATSKCKPGYYKIMMVVAPNNKYGNHRGDFHFYKQHGEVSYKIKATDTYASVARFFGVPYSRVRSSGPLIPGRRLRFKANTWSHKQGWATGPLLTDACGKSIKDPRKSCRKYGYDYSKYCNSFCVKNRGIKVGKRDAHIGHNRFKIF